jgi:hypothetical protein
LAFRAGHEISRLVDDGLVSPFLGAVRIPGPKPTDQHNRCELKPGTPRRSKNALSLVCLLQSLPPYVVYFGLPRFAVPKPVPEAVPGRSARLTCPRKRFETERSFSCPRYSNHPARIG